MIRVHAPLKREAIKALLSGQTIDGHTFSFIKEDGMKLYFSSSEDEQKAVSVAKKAIKSTEYGPALFFMVEYVD